MQIVVIAETEHGAVTRPSLECVEEARDLAIARDLRVRALLPGAGLEEQAATLAAHGADEVTLIEHEALARASADAWLAALEPVIRPLSHRSYGGLLLLAPDTSHMRAWLPRLALRLHAPLVSHCLEVRQDGAGLVFVRPTYGGARHEHMVCPGAAVICATLAPDARGIGRGDVRRRPQVSHVHPAIDTARLRDRPVRTIPADPRTVDLREAERIVAGGLGLGGPEGVAQLWELGNRLGAAVGGTRVISDRGWLPADRFIGTTGKIVAPKLYLALGISGASQHTSGMNGSETVIAVNIDRTAPIFGLADLGIVADVRQLIPALLERLTPQRQQDTADNDHNRQVAA